jgi:beta-lactamase superfamily II metal-dependent hydrolase
MLQPADDEFEFSLFGAGIGECAVVHLGSGSWMVVDSLLADDKSTPIALKYLSDIKVDIAVQVELILLTHWDLDHCRGAAEIVRQANSAKVACSSALQCEEFCQLIAEARSQRYWQSEHELGEFASVLDAINSRSSGKKSVGPDIWACHDQDLFRRESPTVTVRALSPSSAAQTCARAELAQLLPDAEHARRSFRRIHSNETSVALLLQFSHRYFLLGADLEKGADDAYGWRAVVASKVRPQVPAELFKVPHHGGESAHLDSVWDKLLIRQPYAVLTTFSAGKYPLPSKSDIRRLKSKSKRVYCTSRPNWILPPPRKKLLEDIIRHTLLNRRVVSRVGHIRIRGSIADPDAPLRIDRFGSACSL